MPEAAKTMQPAKQVQSPAPAALKLVPPADLLQRAERLYDSVARRAFEIFEKNGGAIGHDLDHWFKAESEVLHSMRIEIAESDSAVTVHAEVPGFKVNELEISVEPRRVTITGKRETKEERKEVKTVYSERRSTQILRAIELPAAVQTDKAEATLKDGVLELKIPKAPPEKKVAISVKEANPDQEC